MQACMHDRVHHGHAVHAWHAWSVDCMNSLARSLILSLLLSRLSLDFFLYIDMGKLPLSFYIAISLERALLSLYIYIYMYIDVHRSRAACVIIFSRSFIYIYIYIYIYMWTQQFVIEADAHNAAAAMAAYMNSCNHACMVIYIYIYIYILRSAALNSHAREPLPCWSFYNADAFVFEL